MNLVDGSCMEARRVCMCVRVGGMCVCMCVYINDAADRCGYQNLKDVSGLVSRGSTSILSNWDNVFIEKKGNHEALGRAFFKGSEYGLNYWCRINQKRTTEALS